MSKKNLDGAIEIPDNFITKLSYLVFGLGNLVHGQIVKGIGFVSRI